MKINELLDYEKAFISETGEDTDPLYLFFDYDERSYSVNMEFQHFHRFYEIHMLLDREAEHLIEGNLYDQRPFDVVFLKPLRLHKSIYPTGPAVKRLVIDFRLPVESVPVLQAEQDELLSLFDMEVPILRLNHAALKEVCDHLQNIQNLYRKQPAGYITSVRNELYAFLSALYKHRKENTYQNKTDDLLETKIYAITSYIHSHFNEELTLDFLAETFYISPHYLSHQFKNITGFTLTNYIQMTRIRNAEQLLLSTHRKITDIAQDCGFNSFSQFNRTFNKLVGKSPSEFRK